MFAAFVKKWTTRITLFFPFTLLHSEIVLILKPLIPPPLLTRSFRRLEHRVGKIGFKHVKRNVGNVKNTHHAEHQGQTGGHQKKEQTRNE